MAEIELNGEPRTVEDSTAVADLVEELLGDAPTAGVAVARNREVVARSRWDETRVEEGDEIEILAAFEGG